MPPSPLYGEDALAVTHTGPYRETHKRMDTNIHIGLLHFKSQTCANLPRLHHPPCGTDLRFDDLFTLVENGSME